MVLSRKGYVANSFQAIHSDRNEVAGFIKAAFID